MVFQTGFLGTSAATAEQELYSKWALFLLSLFNYGNSCVYIMY